MNGAILITGATGFLGTQVTRLILEQTELTIIVLVRGQDLPTVKHRLKRIWWDWPNLVLEIDNRIKVLNGDLSLSKLGLSDSLYNELISSVNYIIHLAADIRLNEQLDRLRKTNVDSVRNILDLAYKVHHDHGLVRFSHVSTAYVAGRRKGSVSEDALTDQYGFSNNYELSKFESESNVKAAGKEIPLSIFRPGMVIGDSKNGAIKTFNTIYFPLRLYLTGKLKFFPVDPSLKINLVPCDYVSEAIVKLTLDPKAQGLSFHLTLPKESLPTVKEMINFTRKWAEEKLHTKLPNPVFMPFPVSLFQWLGRIFPQKSVIHSLLSLAPYFEESRIYQRDNIDKLIGTYNENWQDFFPQILSFAVQHGFMHRSERTVHEQAFFRLSRKSRPIRFHDVTSDKIISSSPGEVSREIRMVVSSMNQIGIHAGDRIAVVGYNSTCYFVIDVAIGLIGGVSVPLYYSSPVSELSDIIDASGSRLMFVGVPEILEKLASTNLKIPVVSFCSEKQKCALPENFMSWQNFLMLGEDYAASIKSPVGFGDIATLRYTSGTTGRPKGAAFNHANLSWMAETIASLPPWKARTQKIIYLSFLPMNHVVEGILTTYALYYAPAPVDVYYLENFHDLQKMLPKIRPTIFFSVPRFYEKVWEQAAKSLIGRMYLRRSDGFVKKLLEFILRFVIKKKAGIDRCAQLIVGSAPASISLLENFRSIGIDIHNAYGLTEAPLITLNRYMANKTDTVGELLPDTKIRIASDGEILVNGPQVMKEYYQDTDESPLEDGWLHTGDVGFLTDDNYLVISGRKKEVIINSYGKNINPIKIELMLREATKINNIMVYSDNKPYCTALLFGCPTDRVAVTEIESAIQKVNQQLSHPEQVKKWTMLTDDLSIEGGDLTANLKMKRSAIALKYAEVIEALYRDHRIQNVDFPYSEFYGS